jgi:predicted TIM-barrel fold metal-dependent hydrolase
MKWMCSADSHFTEPGDLWTKRMPAAMLDDAPRYEIKDGLMHCSVFGNEFTKMPATALLGNNAGSENLRERMAMLDQEGIWSEVLIGNLGGLWVLSFEDPEFAIAAARAYNDYIAETFAPYGDRQIALGMIPVRDVDLAVTEIDRCAKLGIRGITLPLEPHEPYYLEKFEPIWAAAARNGLPISFHATTGGNFKQRVTPEYMAAYFGTSEREQHANKTYNSMKFGRDSFAVMAHLIGTGVLERYPNLHIVFIETNAAWLATAMEAMDVEWAVRPAQELAEGSISYSVDAQGKEVGSSTMMLMGGYWPYPLAPSEYARRQVHATFQNERAAIKFRNAIGISPLLWGSDFPHPEGTWPHTQEVLSSLFADVEPETKAAILGGTVAKLYGIQVPTS